MTWISSAGPAERLFFFFFFEVVAEFRPLCVCVLCGRVILIYYLLLFWVTGTSS